MEQVRAAAASAVCELLAARVEAERAAPLPAAMPEGYGARVVSELDDAIRSGCRALALAKAIDTGDQLAAAYTAYVNGLPTVRRARAA